MVDMEEEDHVKELISAVAVAPPTSEEKDHGSTAVGSNVGGHNNDNGNSNSRDFDDDDDDKSKNTHKENHLSDEKTVTFAHQENPTTGQDEKSSKVDDATGSEKEAPGSNNQNGVGVKVTTNADQSCMSTVLDEEKERQVEAAIRGTTTTTAPMSTNNNANNNSLLKTVLERCPLEDQAETYIQQALEEAGPSNDHVQKAQENILGSIPAEAVGVFTTTSPQPPLDSTKTEAATAAAEAAGGGGGTTTLPTAASRRHARSPTIPTHQRTATNTAELLANLATQMKQMNHEDTVIATTNMDDNNTGTLVSTAAAAVAIAAHQENNSITDDTRKTEASTLAHNATKLISRRFRNSSKTKPDSTSSGDANAGGGSATSKWELLRNQRAEAVKAAAAAKRHSSAGLQLDQDLEAGKNSGTTNVSSTVVTNDDHRDNEDSGHGGSNGKHKARKATYLNDFHKFKEWLGFSKVGIYKFIRRAILYSIIPGTGVAAILFYLAGNPPCGTTKQCEEHFRTTGESNTTKVLDRFYIEEASTSWWVLFVFARQAMTLSLAMLSNAFVVDFLFLQTAGPIRLFGPFVTLFVVQSGGWPFILFAWSILDFAILYGKNPFAHHWLFWQRSIQLFNANNPSGDVVSSVFYRTILIIGVFLSIAVAIKRFWVGLHLGTKTFARNAEGLAKVMAKSMLVAEVARLARDIELNGLLLSDFGFDPKQRKSWFVSDEEAKSMNDQGSSSSFRRSIIPNSSGKIIGMGSLAQHSAKIEQVLGEWEEPECVEPGHEDIDIAAIIQFRQSLSHLSKTFPFGITFGAANTRVECVSAVEHIYDRLLLSTPSRDVLTFDVIALTAIRSDGSLDEDRLRDVVRLFRPDRQGNLTLVDFAKSVDAVYKELRLLRASVVSQSKLDRAVETVYNIVFYVIAVCIILTVFGLNPLTVWGSISALIVGFSFMIGGASSKYFEGLLFILVREPYHIGDRIHISGVNNDTDTTGSSCWIVKDVTLYTTTCVFGSTNEVCTYSNGSLASSRVINAARSPQAVLSFKLKFPIDVPYQKVETFKAAIVKFIQDRPREWLAFTAFRATRVEADLGFVEYIVLGKHRESWQQIGAVLESKAALTSFARVLSRKMGMTYTSPPMPVDLNIKQGNAVIPEELFAGGARTRDEDEKSFNTMDIASVSAMFEDHDE